MADEIRRNETEITFPEGDVRHCEGRMIVDNLKKDCSLFTHVLKEWTVRDVMESIDMAMHIFLRNADYDTITNQSITQQVETVLKIFGVTPKKCHITDEPNVQKSVTLYIKFKELPETFLLSYYVIKEKEQTAS